MMGDIIPDMQYLDNDSTAQKKMTRVAKKEKIYDVGRKGSFIALFLSTFLYSQNLRFLDRDVTPLSRSYNRL